MNEYIEYALLGMAIIILKAMFGYFGYFRWSRKKIGQQVAASTQQTAETVQKLEAEMHKIASDHSGTPIRFDSMAFPHIAEELNNMPEGEASPNTVETQSNSSKKCRIQ